MHKIRRRPKQNFNINFEEINDSILLPTEKRILIRALQYHKANCKYEYRTLTNSFLVNSLSISEPTLIKHRSNLEKENYLKLKSVRRGNRYLLEYRFNWAKLKKLNFILDIDKNEFQPIDSEYEKEYFKEGDLITIENFEKLKDEVLYSIRYREGDKYKKESSPWQSQNMFGNALKQKLKYEQKKQQRHKSEGIDYYAPDFKFIELA